MKITNPILKRHLFTILLGAILGWLVFSFIRDDQSALAVIDIILSCLLGILMSYLVYAITKKLDNKFPWHNQLANRFVVGIIVTYLLVISLFYTSYSLYKLAFPIESNNGVSPNSAFLKFAIISFIIILLYSIIYFALYSYYSYAKHQIDTITYERKQIDLQLKALKSQLSPHFLFNSLNTISSLIHSNTKSAETYIRNLGLMYDYTLKSYYEKQVDLNDELDFLNSYLTLIKTRYENRFECEILLTNAQNNYKIPPLTLQMLVENAVKHNQMHADKPLKVKIYQDGKNIIVQNNITSTPNKISSFQIGLKNIKERYALLQNATIEVIKDDRFTVKLPLLQ